MKITHVISDTNVGGAGILLANLQSELAGRFDFEIILPRGSALISRLDLKKGRITELDFSGDNSFSLLDINKFRRIFKVRQPDIIHTHAALSARIGAALCGVKNLISTRHCAKEASGALGSIKKKLYDLYTTVTVSTAAAATENLIAEGISPHKIVTIQNGSKEAPPLSEKERAALRASLGIPEHATVIGCCGRIERVKGQDTLIRAAPAVIKSHPEAFFLFVGDGGERESAENLARALGVWGRVKFIGYTARARDYQNLFYVNVNASRGTETSCLVTSECMSLGIPTVASDFGGNPEMITHGKNGLIFERDNHYMLAEQLSHLLSNGVLHSALSRGAREEYLQRFSLSRMAEEYERLYRSLPGC